MKALTCKRGISLMMALVLCLAGILGIGTTTAYAAGEQAEVYQIAFPRDGDANYHSEWGHPALQFMNGWSTGDTDQTTVRAMHSYTGEICYCIEVGVGQYTGDVYTNKGEDFWDNYPSSYNSTIAPDDIKLLIGRILQYGYTGNISTSWRSQNEGADSLAHAVATQLLIWETVVGERDAEFRHVSTGGYNAIVEQVSTGHPLYSRIMSYYSSIEASVQNHSALPSFMGRTPGSAQTVELTWDGGAYTASLTDSNGVLSEYSFAAESGIEFAVSGNTLTITAAEAPSDSLVITAEKDAPRRGVITWTDGKIGPNGGTQDMVTYAQTVSDPVKGFLNLKVSYGSARIVKVSEDGVVEGIPFHVSGNGVDTTVTTGAGGEIQIDNLAPGEYTVTEESIDRYVPQESKTVTVLSGQTATVEFSNVLKKFTVTLTKSDSEKGEAQGDATLEKAVYGIYKTYRAGFVAHGNGMRTHAAAKITQAVQQLAFGNSRGSKHAVVAFNHVVNGQHFVYIGNAHVDAAFNLCFIFRAQTCLHIAAKAFNCCGCQYAFRCAALADVHMHAGTFNTCVDNRVNIAVGNEMDACTCAADLVHQIIMAFAVQQYNSQVAYFSVKGFGNALQVFAYRCVDVDAAFGTRANGNFIHIHIGSVKQASFGSNSNYGDSARLAFGNKVRAFNRVNRNINFRAARTDMLADVQHRRFVHFAFTDYNRTADIYRIKHFSHRVNGKLVSPVFITAANAAAAGNSGSFRYTDELHG